MQLGLVGLGKMGFNMRERLREGGHEVIGYDPRPEVTDVPTLAALAEALDRAAGGVGDGAVRSGHRMTRSPRWPTYSARATWSSTAATRATPRTGRTRNCWRDKGIAFIDAGVSGGIWGLTEGYGLMVGGSDADVARAMPIFDTLRPPGELADGFVHAGPVGAGHYAKMVHNGIEYGADDGLRRGLRAAGRRGSDQRHRRRSSRRGPTAPWCGPGCSSCWPRRSRKIPNFAEITGYTEDSGEGRWTVEEAISHRVPMPVIAASLFARFASRQDDSPTMKAVSALRNQFGGHAVKRISESGIALYVRHLGLTRLPVLGAGRTRPGARPHGVRRPERFRQDQSR